MSSSPLVNQKYCRYCGQQTEYKPISEMSNSGVDVFFCFNCTTEYLYFQTEGDLWSYSIYATIHDKMYKWRCFPNSQIAQLWFVGKPGVPGEIKNEECQFITAFGYGQQSALPNITPSNFSTKLGTYLPFL